MNLYKYKVIEFSNSAKRLFAILHCLNRRDELIRLIRWSEKKGLSGPRHCYQTRLDDEARRLFRYSVNYPTLTRITRILVNVKRLITPIPSYLPKGSASMYRYAKT
jgi:hypothetical protein